MAAPRLTITRTQLVLTCVTKPYELAVTVQKIALSVQPTTPANIELTRVQQVIRLAVAVPTPPAISVVHSPVKLTVRPSTSTLQLTALNARVNLAISTPDNVKLSLTTPGRVSLSIGSTGVDGSVAVFLPPADRFDDASDPLHFYFGWVSVAGMWLVRKQIRATSVVTDADNLTDPGYADLDAAWSNKLTLNYA